MKLLLTLSLAGLAVTPVFATLLDLDPGTGLIQYSSGIDDGYGTGRGMWFQANSSFTLSGAGWYNDFSGAESFTETLWTANSTGTVVHGTDLGSFTSGTVAGAAYDDGTFGAPISIVAGDYYYLEVVTQSASTANYFYNWNGSPTVNLGAVTILDGGQGPDPNALQNTVAPGLLLNIQAAPEPVSMAVFGVGAVALLRRRRAKKV